MPLRRSGPRRILRASVIEPRMNVPRALREWPRPGGRRLNRRTPGLSAARSLRCPLSARNRSGGCRPASGSSGTTTKGVRHSGGAFPSKSAARAHYRDEIEPELERQASRTARPDAAGARRRVPRASRDRREADGRSRSSEGGSSSPQTKFGTVPLVELEGMADEIAGFAVGLPERYRYPIMSAFRQTLEAGVRYGYMTRNPAKLAGKNPQPAPREIRVYTAAELKAITDELDTVEARRGQVRRRDRAPALRVGVDRAAETSTGPAGWCTCGAPRRPAHAARCRSRRRRSPRSTRVPPRLDCRYVFTTSRKCPGRASRGRSTSRTSAGGMGAGDRSRRDREARPDLRPPVDVRLKRARGRNHDVRARPDHGHEREDDRGRTTAR